MTKVDIFSGFLGAGKTTLIKKLLADGYQGQKVVLIENEFGEIGIDGGFLQEAGVQVTEMNSGCICCSLVGDFGEALGKVVREYAPDRILIEPSGVGKLSDVIRAVQNAGCDALELNAAVTVADAKKCRMHMKNFGEFFNNQIEHAACIILSHTDGMDEAKLAECIALLREHNPTVEIITTPWEALSGAAILAAMERKDTLADELARLAEDEDVCPVCGHHHDDDEDECCHHHHHDDDDDDEHECHHHHHDDDDDDDEHECHHHHHDDDDDDDDEHECHHHHHDDDDEHEHECHHHGHHHHHHHADEVFQSIGFETAKAYDPAEIAACLAALTDEEKYGQILRAKGYLPARDGGAWIHFDYVPGEPDVRTGGAMTIGRICVIGAKVKDGEIRRLFRME